MANVVKTIFEADGRKLESTINRSGKAIQNFTAKSIGAFGKMKKSITGITGSVGSLGRQLGLAVTAYGILNAAKSVVDFDATLARLRIQAKLSKKEVYELKKEILWLGDAVNQTPEELVSGVAKIVEKTGDLKMARSIIKDVGIAASGSGAEMKDMASIAADMKQKLKIDDVLSGFDVLVQQGEKGSFELNQMSQELPALFSKMGVLGQQGMGAVRALGAYMQVTKRAFGDEPGEAGTSVLMLLNELTSKSKEIKKVTGFDIFDPEKTKQSGRHVMKNLDVVLKEIIERTGGDVKKLQDIFDVRSIKGMEAMAQSYVDAGKSWKEFDELMQTGGDKSMINQNFGMWMESSASKFKDLGIKWTQLKNVVLEAPVNQTSYMINKAINPRDESDKRGWFGRSLDIGPAFPEEKTLAPVNVNNIDIHIDEKDRVTTNTDNLNTKTKVNIDRRGDLRKK